MPASEHINVLLIDKNPHENDDLLPVNMSDSKPANTNDHNNEETVKGDTQEGEIPVAKVKRTTKRLTGLEKTAQEGAAILKGLDITIGEVEGRRRTRSSARGVVAPAPTPPKREKKDSSIRGGGGRGRGRPKKNDPDDEYNDESKIYDETQSDSTRGDVEHGEVGAKKTEIENDTNADNNQDKTEVNSKNNKLSPEESGNSEDPCKEREIEDDKKDKKHESPIPNNDACKNSTQNDVSASPSLKEIVSPDALLEKKAE